MHTQSPSALVGMLQSETRAIDSASEKESRVFLDGDMPLREFLSSYLEKRQLYHLRASKLETIQRTM